jgi:glycosyltransferase involved in cell wall biosynthesis
MKVVVTIAALDFEHGGPPRTVIGLCRALVHLNIEVVLVTIGEYGRSVAATQEDGFVSTVIPTQADRYHPASWATSFKDSLVRALRGRNDAVLYDVGLWLPSNHFAAQIAAKIQTPFVVSPRGMLSEEALKVSRWKKSIAWHLYQRRDLKRARVLHATSESEAHDFRARKLFQLVAIVPNGVELPAEFSKRAVDNKSVRTLLFLSRLHPIKGLKDLVSAWARVRPNGWRVVVAGPSENAHQQDVEEAAESLGVRTDFNFVGPVGDREKWKLLTEADLFALPSYSESFGLVIAEALAAGLPVITTRATPWRELESNRCGWWVPTGADAMTTALSSATACSREELQHMGERGRELVLRNYSWESVARNLLSVFEWLISRGDRPSWLV